MFDFLKRRVFQNFGLKIFSLILAIGLWLIVSRDTRDEVALNVPIEFHNIPDKLEINSEEVPVAQVRVRGAQVFRRHGAAFLERDVERVGHAPLDGRARHPVDRLEPLAGGLEVDAEQ